MIINIKYMWSCSHHDCQHFNWNLIQINSIKKFTGLTGIRTT